MYRASEAAVKESYACTGTSLSAGQRRAPRLDIFLFLFDAPYLSAVIPFMGENIYI